MQSRSGGGGGIHTPGYEGSQFAAGFRVAVGAGGRAVGDFVITSVGFGVFTGVLDTVNTTVATVVLVAVGLSVGVALDVGKDITVGIAVESDVAIGVAVINPSVVVGLIERDGLVSVPRITQARQEKTRTTAVPSMPTIVHSFLVTVILHSLTYVATILIAKMKMTNVRLASTTGVQPLVVLL